MDSKKVSDWVRRIDKLLTPDRPTARFEATPEVNWHRHLSRYRSSRDHSSSIEDQDVSPRVCLPYSRGYLIAVAYNRS